MIANPISWPDRNRCVVALTWDVDVDSGLNYMHPDTADNLVATQSFLRYGPAIAIRRLMTLLRQLELRQTFFVPGWVIERYPATVDAILENGHEVDLLIEAGFDYDSSLMGDDIPYMLKGAKGGLLEFATDWTNDDWPHYVLNRDFRFMMPISSPAPAMEVFRAEFDAAWEYGALWITVWHPFVSGRLARPRAIAGLIDYMRKRGGVWLARLDEVCDHTRRRMRDGEWRPRVEAIPPYRSPIPELIRTRGAAGTGAKA